MSWRFQKTFFPEIFDIPCANISNIECQGLVAEEEGAERHEAEEVGMEVKDFCYS